MTTIRTAHIEDAEEISAVLQEAAHWIASTGTPIWTASEVSLERVQRDIQAGTFRAAVHEGKIIGVMRFELEDPVFWPEIEAGTSTYVHKLAVHRQWARTGLSTEMLDFARCLTQDLVRQFLRLDCFAGRPKLCAVYERFGFTLHSYLQKRTGSMARYEYAVAAPAGDYSSA